MTSISVIIPAFNCAPWIRQAIDSVLNQSIPVHEIIVVDDGSTDDTANVLASCGQKIQTIRQPNQGVATARNTAIRRASGELIAFLDADDVWHPRKLELQLRVMASNPNIGLLGTGLFAWPAASMPEANDEPPTLVVIDRNALAVKNYLATSSIILRRELVRQIGEFDTALCGPEDHDYWLRAVDVASIAILPLQLTGYRSVPGSLSKRAATMEAGMRRILLKLDRQNFWRGNRLLRRRAYSYANYSSAYLHGVAGKQWSAITRLLGSLMWYPLPLRRTEAGASFGRFKRLVVTMRRFFNVMRPDPGF
ncbi:MAG TPA: glycosyltransferase family 2 protein [Tepidisphaeraceae bacterium]|nr:glycosyltransferase family 2 protein [Tepidisphaeraceae bacterium]